MVSHRPRSKQDLAPRRSSTPQSAAEPAGPPDAVGVSPLGPAPDAAAANPATWTLYGGQVDPGAVAAARGSDNGSGGGGAGAGGAEAVGCGEDDSVDLSEEGWGSEFDAEEGPDLCDVVAIDTDRPVRVEGGAREESRGGGRVAEGAGHTGDERQTGRWRMGDARARLQHQQPQLWREGGERASGGRAALAARWR